MKEKKLFRELYPIEHFPLLRELLDNIKEVKDKNIYYPLFVNASFEDGLYIICIIDDSSENPEENVGCKIYVSANTCFQDLIYLGFKWDTEENIKSMLSERNECFFNIDRWSKEDIQKYYIEEILNGDVSGDEEE